MTADDLKQWRVTASLSQGQLARALGVDVMTISRWEREERAIPSFLPLALETLERRQALTPLAIAHREIEESQDVNETLAALAKFEKANS